MQNQVLQFVLRLTGIRTVKQELFHIEGVSFRNASGVELLARRWSWGRLYTCAVWGSLIVPSVYAIAHFATHRDGASLAEAAISLMAPLQYACAVLYFATDHFDQFHSTDDLDSTDVSTVLARPCVCSPDLIATLAASATAIFFIASSFDQDSDIVLRVFHVFSRTYGAFGIIMNALAITYVFFKHVKVIQVYVKIFMSQDWHTCEDHHISVLLRNLVRIRESLHVSTELLSRVFSSSVILGVTLMGAVIGGTEETFSYTAYASLIMFGVTQVVFFGVVYLLSEAKDDIENLVRSADFADSFLTRTAQATSARRVRETSTTLDWFVLKYVLSERWIEFLVLGMPLHSATFLKQMVTAVAAFVVLVGEGGLG